MAERPRRKASPTWAVAVSVAASVALHGLVLLDPGPAPVLTAAAAPAVAVRFMTVPDGPDPVSTGDAAAPLETATATDTATAPSARPDATEPPSAAATPAPSAGRPLPSPSAPPPTAVTDTATPTAPADAAPPDAPALSANLPAVDGYVLRKALTQAPAPLDEVQLPWPAGAGVVGRFKAVFSLFIDESGWPQRMVPDGPTLPPALEAQARRVFMGTRFAPGQVDGRVVKSLVRIEVEFDSTLAAASSPRRPAVISSQNL